MAYAASSDLTDYVDFDTDATVDATLISDLLNRSSAIIDDYCGRVFTAALASITSDMASSDGTTRYFDAIRDVDGTELLLDRDLAHVFAVTNGDATTVTSDQYVLLPHDPPHYALRLRASAGIAWTYTSDPEESIQVVGHWSYNSSSDNMAAITHACVRLAHWLYKQRESQADLDRPLMVAGSGNIIMPTRLPEDVLSILGPYRVIRVR